MNTKTIQKGIFSVEGFDGVFEGFSKKEYDNGSAIPYFPLESALSVMDSVNADLPSDYTLKFNETTRLLTLTSVEDDIEDQEISPETLIYNGVEYEVYAFECGWLWQEELQ